jgi:hypothetical protein
MNVKKQFIAKKKMSAGAEGGYYPGATGLVFLVLLFLIGLAILVYACTRKNHALKDLSSSSSSDPTSQINDPLLVAAINDPQFVLHEA